MCMEGWALQRICNFCIMWSWANTCDEHVEREILKTIVKRRELCYFPLKNIHTWLWIGWFSYLHRHMHTAVLLFRRKFNSWHFILLKASACNCKCYIPQRALPLKDCTVTPARCSWELALEVICLLYQLDEQHGAEPKLTWIHCFWARYTCFRLSQNLEGVDTWKPLSREVCVRHILNTGTQALHRRGTSVHHSFWSLLSPNFFSPKASTSATNQTLEETFSAAHRLDPLCFYFLFAYVSLLSSSSACAVQHCKVLTATDVWQCWVRSTVHPAQHLAPDRSQNWTV